MPFYAVYKREKNSKEGTLLFNGELIKAEDEAGAKRKALAKVKGLRFSRLMAVRQQDIIVPKIPHIQAEILPIEGAP